MIETPATDRLAAMGVRFSQWHTTALCSPTGKFTLAGDGICVGWDSADAVSHDYRAPATFPGGRIHLVAVDVSGRPVVDLEREFHALLARG